MKKILALTLLCAITASHATENTAAEKMHAREYAMAAGINSVVAVICGVAAWADYSCNPDVKKCHPENPGLFSVFGLGAAGCAGHCAWKSYELFKTSRTLENRLR